MDVVGDELEPVVKAAIIDKRSLVIKEALDFSLQEQSLQELVRSGTVAPQEALERSYEKEQFKTFLAALPKSEVARG